MIKGEPTLAKLLDEPIVHLLVASDGVSIDALRQLTDRVRRKLDDRKPELSRGNLRLRVPGV